MGLILSEPMKKVVEIPKILAKSSVEDAKFHPKRPYRLRTSPGKKGRKKHTKNISPVFSQKKPFFRESPVFLAALLTCVYCNGSCLDDNAHFFLHCPFHAAARLLMLQAIHTATIQAGANFRWAEYDRFPMLQVHTLLGVGDLTEALRAAGNGLLTKIVGAAAKFVLRATRERANAV